MLRALKSQPIICGIRLCVCCGPLGVYHIGAAQPCSLQVHVFLADEIGQLVWRKHHVERTLGLLKDVVAALLRKAHTIGGTLDVIVEEHGCIYLA